jgi:hypothetical protein
MPPLLVPRALNRATLARQWLLERHDAPPEAAVAHLVGLQAQAPQAPFVGLWSRLVDPAPDRLSDALAQRRLARLTLMRATVHLVTVADAQTLRPLVQPVIERGTQGAFGRQLAGLDPGDGRAATLALLAGGPRTGVELGRGLRERFPGRDELALRSAARTWAALVQVPPRGLWRRSGHPTYVTLEDWAGDGAPPPTTLTTLVRRYLGAYGPATVADMQRWCGLTRLGEVFAALRDDLVTFSDDHGRELFDLPDAPRPARDTPAPPRFLPEYDNLLLSHDDRARVIADEHREAVFGVGALLVDGVVAASWRLQRARRAATLTIAPLRTIARRDRAAVSREAERLLAFAAPEATTRRVAFAASGGRRRAPGR